MWFGSGHGAYIPRSISTTSGYKPLLLTQESLRVQEFFLQVDEEEAWIRERELQAASTDYGKDHSAVVTLQQKHQALEAEIQG